MLYVCVGETSVHVQSDVVNGSEIAFLIRIIFSNRL